jgi:hypothetical protein
VTKVKEEEPEWMAHTCLQVLLHGLHVPDDELALLVMEEFCNEPTMIGRC